MNIRSMTMIAAGLLAASAAAAAGTQDSPQGLAAPVPAASSPIATQATMLGSAWAGTRAVAVGDRGIVLLSDDKGGHWRQAQRVPVSFTLTAVGFADERRGWAVGHGGSIVATSDGGETWQLQRFAFDEDRPLFALHVFDAQRAVAVGLWSLVLVTEDGGKSWTEQTLQAMPGAKKADLNLLGMFVDARGNLYATAERGQVLRSTDRGASWSYLDTGYKGSLWAGAAMSDGALLVGGQRGTLLRSDDEGLSWKAVPLDTKSSITSIAARLGHVSVAGLDGLLAHSADGRQFKLVTRADGLAITSTLVMANASPLLFSRRGVIPLGSEEKP